jgi:hypothetical protein
VLSSSLHAAAQIDECADGDAGFTFLADVDERGLRSDRDDSAIDRLAAPQTSRLYRLREQRRGVLVGVVILLVHIPDSIVAEVQ